MVALKTSEIDGFIRKPPTRASLILVYGPDEGLVRERANALVKQATGGVDDPFSVQKLDGADVVADPARLIDEALTVSLFGGRRVVWVRDAGSRNLLPAVEPLLAHPDPQSFVVIEAGDLKKGTGLRKKVEDHASAVAIPCYADSAADLGRLIEAEAKEAGLSIDRDARMALEALLGADRLASRGEIRKLCLYAHGAKEITVADVGAIVGDASALALDEMIDAVATGDVFAADSIQAKLEASGTPASVAGTMAIRRFQLLHRARAEVETGRSASEVVERMQPPVMFKRKDAMVQQLGLWSLTRLERAMALLDQALLQSRIKPALASAVLSEAFLSLARVARANRRR